MNPYISAPKNLLYFSLFYILFCLNSVTDYLFRSFYSGLSIRLSALPSAIPENAVPAYTYP